MHKSIESRREGISALCRRYGVRRLEAFGSAARGVDFNAATSDADFLVEFDASTGLGALEQFFGLAEGLRRLLDRPVDLVERSAIANPFVLQDIERARELVYEA